ncbi:MAG: (deoxy)nucleoside triphosphate pyrophosphohydrolase [Magnetococcales bacterium]|nr:(deoxy)nucleoside triphosphate pyrophosphohydrolase [Magnetococcales bacterium]
MRRPLILVVAAWIQDDAGRTLFSQRRPGDSFPLHWEFPGGKVREDETPEEALVRELREELDITVLDPQPWTFVSHPYEQFHLLMTVYRCTRFIGTPKPIEVHRFSWLTQEELIGLPFPPADLPLLERMRWSVQTGPGTG